MVKEHTFLIDDDPVVIFLMKKLIQKTELSSAPLAFEKAKLALENLKENYSPADSYILFLDINMPEMSGWDFLEELEKFANPVNTRVYIITSSTDEADAEKADANKFVRKLLVKPILKEDLLEISLADKQLG